MWLQAAQFNVLNVPYPFTSREQYERAMRQPIGPDFNTLSAHARLTMPEVRVRSSVLLPLCGPTQWESRVHPCTSVCSVLFAMVLSTC